MSANMRLLKFQANGSAIAYAKDLLARCESGQVVAVTAIEEEPGGTYRLQGSSVSSRTATAGMLLDAAITRLQSE